MCTIPMELKFPLDGKEGSVLPPSRSIEVAQHKLHLLRDLDTMSMSILIN